MCLGSLHPGSASKSHLIGLHVMIILSVVKEARSSTPGPSHASRTNARMPVTLLNQSKNLQLASGQTASLNLMIPLYCCHQHGYNTELHSQQVPILSSQMFHWDKFITEWA